MAPGFRVIATTEGCGFAAVENAEKKLYGVQFHPEVLHTVYGTQVLENFLYRVCGFSAEWTMASYLDEAVAECRRQIGSGRVLLAPAAQTALTSAQLEGFTRQLRQVQNDMLLEVQQLTPVLERRADSGTLYHLAAFRQSFYQLCRLSRKIGRAHV